MLLCSIFITSAACSSTGRVNKTASESSGKSEKTAEESHLEEIFWSRVDSSKMQFTQADVDFMTGMIAHHAQALIMSDLAPKNNAGPAIRTLASRIINTQKDEIQSMQQWLRERNRPVPEVQIDGLILTIKMKSAEEGDSSHSHMQHSHSAHADMDHSGMPGMLTQQQLNELSELTGDAFDRTFLKYMIAHHQGAVIMVKELFSKDGAALDHQAFRLASDIQVDQKTEIERMKLMLQTLDNS